MSDGNGEEKGLAVIVAKPDEFGRFSVAEAEAEPEVRLHRLECTMRVVLDTLIRIEGTMPVVCCKIKGLDIDMRATQDALRQIVRMKR